MDWELLELQSDSLNVSTHLAITSWILSLIHIFLLWLSFCSFTTVTLLEALADTFAAAREALHEQAHMSSLIVQRYVFMLHGHHISCWFLAHFKPELDAVFLLAILELY